MANAEVQQLLERLNDTDLSLANQGIQRIIQKEVEDWVESYLDKKDGCEKHIDRYDCYGGPGKIPDEIQFDGHTYSPVEILDHVKARDEVGIAIMRQMYAYHDSDPMFSDMKKQVTHILQGGKDLDEVLFACACGEHNETRRSLTEGVINADPDSFLLRVGWPDAIMSLYRHPDELPSYHRIHQTESERL